MTFKDELPKYYEIDGDIYVKIFLDGDEIRAVNNNGMPYEPFRAVRNGIRISRAEFEQAVFGK